MLPEPTPNLLPPNIPLPVAEPPIIAAPPVEKPMCSPRNVFGLVCQYLTKNLLSHNPEELVTLEDLAPDNPLPDNPLLPPEQLPTTKSKPLPYYSYPNLSSFRLGGWYWNGSTHKSKQDLKKLVEIVGSDEYIPNNVHHTKWDAVDKILGDNVVIESGEDTQAEWMDEDVGWNKTHIKISVLFSKNMKHSGSREYVSIDLHHRSIVQVIKECLADPHTSPLFHVEPYELRWQHTEDYPKVKLHGEMYTSEAFLQAQKDLQQSPREPGCDLERVVVSLMFWSDSTHLTSFGNSHLWPCYLYFGNESKYWRYKPSCNLCSHITYFQSVCQPNFVLYTELTRYVSSCPMNLRISWLNT